MKTSRRDFLRTSLAAVGAPALAASFGEFPPFVDETFESFRQIACGEAGFPFEYPLPVQWTDEFISWSAQDRSKTGVENDWLCVREGTCEGRLIGGNLNTMQGFFGTEYMPEICEGDVLLIEDSLKDAATIERSFSLMKLAGVFDRVGGIILGKHEQFDDCGSGRRPHEILMEVLGEFNRPLLAEFDCCHTHPMLTMPIGCRVRLDAGSKKVVLLENPLN